MKSARFIAISNKLFSAHKIKIFKIFLFTFVYIFLNTNHPCYKLNQQTILLESNLSKNISSNKKIIYNENSNYNPNCLTCFDSDQCCKSFMTKSVQHTFFNLNLFPISSYFDRKIKFITSLNDIFRPPIS